MQQTFSPNYIDVYANNWNTHVTLSDIAVRYGHIGMPREGENQNVQHHCSVKMSPQSFKAYIYEMSRILYEFEQKFGEISIAEIPKLEATNPAAAESEAAA